MSRRAKIMIDGERCIHCPSKDHIGMKALDEFVLILPLRGSMLFIGIRNVFNEFDGTLVKVLLVLAKHLRRATTVE